MDCRDLFQYHNPKSRFCSVPFPMGDAFIGRWSSRVKINKLNFFLIHDYPPQHPFSSPFYLILSRNWFEHSKMKSALFLKCEVLGCEKERHFPGKNQGFTQSMWYFSEDMHCLEFFMTFLPAFQLPTRIPISSLSLVVDTLLWVNCDQWVHT